MAGELIARAIVESDDSWRAFIPYELVWAGGAAGRAFVQATTRWWQLSEAVAAGMARRRERAEKRRDHEHRNRAQPGRPRPLPRPAYREVPAAALDPAHEFPPHHPDDASGASGQRALAGEAAAVAAEAAGEGAETKPAAGSAPEGVTS
jgi:hypothetical protein